MKIIKRFWVLGILSLFFIQFSNILFATNMLDPDKVYRLENQYSGKVIQQSKQKPPLLEDQYARWNSRRVVIEKIEKNSKIYYKIKTLDGKRYFGAPIKNGDLIKVDKNGDSDEYLWEIIPYVTSDNHRFGYFMIRNLKTHNYLCDKINPRRVLDQRDPEKDENGVTTKPLIKDDRRFLWEFGLIEESVIETLAVPQGGWDTSAEKIAVLSSKTKLKEPVPFYIIYKGRKYKKKAVYWGQYWDKMYY